MAYRPTLRDESLWEHPWWRKQRGDGLEEEIAPVVGAMRHASHTYMQQTRSGRPEAVVKIISGASGQGHSRNIMDYIARDTETLRAEGREQVALETQDGELLTTDTDRDACLNAWAQDFEDPERTKRQAWKHDLIQKLEDERSQLGGQQVIGGLSGKEQVRLDELNLALKTLRYPQGDKTLDLTINAPKDSLHMLLSVGGQGHKTASAKEAVRQFLNENFGADGYEYVFAEHTDTDNLHYHVILKARNRITGERLKFNKEDLFNLRQEFTYQLAMHGIERAATLRQDRVVTYESIHKQRETLQTNLSWYESKVANAQAVDAFGVKGNALKQTERLLMLAKEALAKAAKEQKPSLKQEVLELEQHKKTLLELKPGQFEKEREATVKQISQDHAKIMAKKDAKPVEMSPARRRRMEYNQLIWAKRHQNRIEQTIQQLKRAHRGLSEDGRKINQSIIGMLEELRRGMRKGLRW